ncbi:MAG: STAS domain-containing protein [Candidatus Sericytochromatia bacterium]|uniref:Anti-sigma factor antagonist n=1 Tax=Candidatus Tanganyikabacteria bacterium TaxID=2961651 RepID=A0A937X497_9BACT|nr:STAS domain-containing protein [Candidatus Tanganyikabacteria bacterium]
MADPSQPQSKILLDLEVYSLFAVVHVSGTITVDTLPAFEEKIDKAFEGDRKSLVLDFAGLSFISSSGLGAIMAAQRQAQERGGEVVFACIQPEIRRVFDLFDLDEFFRSFDSVALATNALLQRNPR